jgi:hypothetical protein
MSKPKPAGEVKLIMSVFSADRDRLNESLEALSGHYGSADFISAFMPFDFTDYYRGEMGLPLVRRFVSFEGLVRPESLPDVKILTNGVEEKFTLDGVRRVNVDPGYISPAHLILATGKGYAHRPYLRDGIYADLTLIYRAGAFHTLPWTYPDYAAEATRELMQRIRTKYISQLNAAAGPLSAASRGETGAS